MVTSLISRIYQLISLPEVLIEVGLYTYLYKWVCVCVCKCLHLYYILKKILSNINYATVSQVPFVALILNLDGMYASSIKVPVLCYRNLWWNWHYTWLHRVGNYKNLGTSNRNWKLTPDWNKESCDRIDIENFFCGTMVLSIYNKWRIIHWSDSMLPWAIPPFSFSIGSITNFKIVTSRWYTSSHILRRLILKTRAMVLDPAKRAMRNSIPRITKHVLCIPDASQAQVWPSVTAGEECMERRALAAGDVPATVESGQSFVMAKARVGV